MLGRTPGGLGVHRVGVGDLSHGPDPARRDARLSGGDHLGPLGSGMSLSGPQQSLSKERLPINFSNSAATRPWPQPRSVGAAEQTTDLSLSES